MHFKNWEKKKIPVAQRVFIVNCIWFKYVFIHTLHCIAHEVNGGANTRSLAIIEARAFQIDFHLSRSSSKSLNLNARSGVNFAFKKICKMLRGERQKSSATCFLLDVNPETKFQRDQAVEDALPHRSTTCTAAAVRQPPWQKDLLLLLL